MAATRKSEAAIINQEDAIKDCIDEYFKNVVEDSVLTDEETNGMRKISKSQTRGHLSHIH